MKTLEDVGSVLREKVQEYFQDEEHRRKFEKWYKEKYHKDYEWRK
jgi:NAD-dependent DNA ligase